MPPQTRYLGAEFFSLLFSHDAPTPEKYVELLEKQRSNLLSKVRSRRVVWFAFVVFVHWW